MGAALVPPPLEGGRATTLPCERHGSGRERADADYSHDVIGVQWTRGRFWRWDAPFGAPRGGVRRKKTVTPGEPRQQRGRGSIGGPNFTMSDVGGAPGGGLTSATVAQRQPRASSKPPTTAPSERPRDEGVRQVVGVATAAAGMSAASSGATTGQRINIWVRQPFELVLYFGLQRC